MMLQPAAGHVSAVLSPGNDVTEQIKADWISHGGQRFNLGLLILAILNIIATVFIIISIIYNAWFTMDWDFYPQTRRRHLVLLPTVHPAEVFPLVMSFVTVLQGVILVGVSAGEVHNVLSPRCRTIAQIAWPTLWIGPYITLAFGIQTTYRSLQSGKFARQSRWHVGICVSAALFLTLITWVPSYTTSPTGQCLSNPIWWTAHYAKAGIALTVTLIVAFACSAATIIYQLTTTAKVDSDQRLQASIVVYYLIIGSILLSSILPFYIQSFVTKSAISASKVADIALNLTGILPGLVRLCLRASVDTKRTAIRNIPHICSGWGRKRHHRPYGSGEWDIYSHMALPVPLHVDISPKISQDPEKHCTENPSPAESSSQKCQALDTTPPLQAREPLQASQPPTVMISQPDFSPHVHFSRPPPRFSLANRSSASTVFSQGDSDVDVPRPLFAYSHARSLSQQSSATVQIGLRLSYLNHALDPRTSSTGKHAWNLPSRAAPFLTVPSSPSPHSPAPSRSPAARGNADNLTIVPIRPEELHLLSQPLTPRSGLLTPKWLSRDGSTLHISCSPRSPRKDQNRSNSRFRDPAKDVMKMLPPVPHAGTATA